VRHSAAPGPGPGQSERLTAAGPHPGYLDGFGPLPDDIAVHLDAGYDSGKTRTLLDERKLTGEIAHKGEKVPVQATGRWYIERTNAWQLPQRRR
jgi:hypothetical protein